MNNKNERQHYVSRVLLERFALAFAAQLFHHARTAISLPAASVNLVNLLHQGPVLEGSWTRTVVPRLPGVVAAGRDFQVQAERKDRVIFFHRVNPFIALQDGSERMPNVFFKMVHCSRK